MKSNKVNGGVRSGRPLLNNTKQGQQLITETLQAKLVNCLPPKGKKLFVDFRGGRRVAKTLAMRKFIKSQRATIVIQEPVSQPFENL